MALMLFDQAGTRYYNTGVSNLALFVIAGANDTKPAAATVGGTTVTQSLYKEGVAWNGITSATNSPSGGDEAELWADNIKYGSMRAAEKSGGTLECYQFPQEFWPCNGAIIKNGVVVGQQARKKFAFAYKTTVGNDQTGDAGEILHLVWNSSTNPSQMQSQTINDSPSAGTFSFEYSSDAVAYTVGTYANDSDLKPCSTMEINTTTLTNGKNNANYKDLLAIIYGRDADSTTTPETAAIQPQMPSPDDVMTIMGRALPSG